MQYKTIVIAAVPRVNCTVHGVHQVQVPWAEAGGRFTAMFEALIIDWLHEASVSAVRRELGLSWDQVAHVQARAVKRGLARRELEPPTAVGLDETSFRKGHDYVTVMNDIDRSRVIHVADNRTVASADECFAALDESNAKSLRWITMDMWPAYIKSATGHVPDAAERIVFDKFHIAQYLGNAIDLVRSEEHRELMRGGNDRLKGSRYSWLRNPQNMSHRQRRSFKALRTSKLKVARAWAIKELAMTLWNYQTRGWAERAWKRWYSWAIRCRLEPIKNVARTIKRHWQGVINAAVSNVTNAAAESINSRIQKVKRMAHGFRNRDRFRDAIYFHLGGLDLYPDGAQYAHTES